MRIVKLLILFIFIYVNAYSQADTTKLVKYGAGVKFEDGLFLNFQQVKNNAPIPKSRIVTSVNLNDLDFFEKVLRDKIVSYFDEYGLKQEVKTIDIWGYSRKGSLYIQWGEVFNRIPVVGNICHFVANIRVYNDRYYDPYASNYYASPTPSSTYELKQLMLDFETGKILEYNYENLLVILMRDSELYEEYNSLKKRKKRDQRFLFVRKYNEKYPLYIPIH
jgi:hypothetical protein